MGELFRSFDESWSHFLAREEPLESFVDGLPEGESATVAVWLIALAPELAVRVGALQRRLPQVDWLRPLPPHFLHVTLAEHGFLDERSRVAELLEHGRDALRGLRRFRLAFPRLNCFHEAVVAEVEGETEALRDAAARLRGSTAEPFLPHLSLAYTTASGPVAELRDALVRLRETHLGEQEVGAIQLCLVDAPPEGLH